MGTLELSRGDIFSRLTGRTEEIAREAFSRITMYTESGGPLGSSEKGVELLQTILDRALVLYRQGDKGLPTDELAKCTAVAVQLAERGERITPLLHAWEVGCSAAVAACWVAAQPGEQSELVSLTQWASTAVKEITAAISLAYVHAQKQAGLDTSRRVLAELMLNGSATDELAAAARHTPAQEYVVVAGRVVDEIVPGAATVARASAALTNGDLGLSCQVGRHLCVLAPRRAPMGPVERVGQIVAALKQAGIVFATSAGAVTAPRPELAVAIQHAARIESLANIAGLDGTMIESHQVISELAISRDSEYRRQLISLIEPIVDTPELLKTLRTLYLMDLDRTRTARRLNVARRTLTYRLERIEQLTGINPVRTRGILAFVLALAAWDLDPSCTVPESA
ncbi:PucR family transcriptional regulator [Streptomyces coelicoflavus]|uniref:PucR family transcriptional regulator n=1 Tax=Streptomyces coelicoflavus TaxID=285562 RepID=A0A7K3PMV6_9ACTN|nr:helix-turn-helix domain-containing protein [Streptomyces coelicoflavus]NEB11273.1 PucR family transcriptional regulator [Streptomyces coelicoflavus]